MILEIIEKCSLWGEKAFLINMHEDDPLEDNRQINTNTFRVRSFLHFRKNESEKRRGIGVLY